ncbi:wax ester/triacylglycerol synthase domain-containing protein [Nocardia sp. NPDC087230]|uniref:wax ester/triacylglycerol synthase domain-containing protein n=1 Tax=Nocardia sp. NPDC087230 TaxID=3364331 RepID=UPI0038304560
MRGSRLSETDFLTWRLQQNPILRPTIVAVLILDSAPGWDRLVGAVERATRAVPEFRSKLVGERLGLRPPHWVPDQAFDLSWHLREVRTHRPVDASVALEFARAEAMAVFDRARPLWRAQLIQGPDDGTAALVLTVHHTLTDGVGGMRMLSAMCDGEAAGHRSDTGPAAGATRSGPAHRVRSVRGAATAVTSLARLVKPVLSTLSPVMTERSTGRRLAVLDLPAEQLRRSAHTAGCTINDAFLTAVLLGLRRYHDQHGATVDRLRVTMPISLRATDDPLGGNRISLARFVVPADIADATDLMLAVDTAVSAQRNEPGVHYSGAAAAVLNRVPIRLISSMLEHIDFVASDVPGSPVPQFLAGARIDRLYAFSPTLGASFNITLTTNTGICGVGINADTAAVPDLPALRDCVAAGFDAVLRVGRDSGETDQT